MKQEGIKQDAVMYADSTNPDKIVTIQNAGFRRYYPAKKDVIASIDFIKSKKLYITSDSVNLIKELGIYSWKLDKNGDAIEVPVKLFDDALDAVRYAVFTGEKIKISLAVAGATKNNGLGGYGGRIHRTESDSSFRGFE